MCRIMLKNRSLKKRNQIKLKKQKSLTKHEKSNNKVKKQLWVEKTKEVFSSKLTQKVGMYIET